MIDLFGTNKIYRLKRDFAVQHNFSVDYTIACAGGTIDEKYIKIKAGYEWNGCTPKWRIDVFGWDVILGTPDGLLGRDGQKWAYYAALVHDFGYRNSNIHKIPRKEWDKLFLEMLKDNSKTTFGRLMAWVYATAVKGAGTPNWLLYKNNAWSLDWWRRRVLTYWRRGNDF